MKAKFFTLIAALFLLGNQGYSQKNNSFNIKKQLDYCAEQASKTLKVNWNKSAGATKYRVTVTPESGKPIVLITTDPNISVYLGSSSKATLKIVAIGTNGTTSKVINKAF